MTSDTVLMIVIVLGRGLCCESFRAELVRWRREEAAERRRASRQRDLYAKGLPDPGTVMMPEVDDTETEVKPSTSTPEGALRDSRVCVRNFKSSPGVTISARSDLAA